MKNSRLKTVGFTLIELLIVVAIIAILAAIAVPNFLEAQTRAKVSSAKSNMRTCVNGLESYFVDNNKYPPDRGFGNFYEDWSQITTPIAYLSSIPLDPFPMEEIPPVLVPFVEPGQTIPYDYGAPVEAWWTGGGLPNYHEYGIFYFFMSPGPDLVPNTFFTRGDGHALMVQLPGPGADLLYDPTNGTISVGDLIALSKGGLQN